MNESEQLTKQQYQELGEIFRPTGKYPVETVKKWLKSNEVKNIADSDLRNVLMREGIDLDFIVKEQKDLLKLSKEDKQYSVTHKVIQGLKDDLGINTKIKISETRKTDENGTKIVQSYQTAISERDKIKPKNVENEEKKSSDSKEIK